MNSDIPLKDAGYNKEELYIRQKEAERRAELDAQRAEQQSREERKSHWMRCPKCGGQMKEQRLDVVLVDICGDCGVVCFDKGEVEMLLQSTARSSSFLGKMKDFFK
ncbi:MAG: hypothetical protein RL095_86 [Verrucomicrobiota bacterium]|jgi:acetyl-CoA carboxylase beta subunit